MKALGRTGQRENIVEASGLNMPVNLAFSNLQELQWSAISNQGEGTSNWSHEVPLAEWVHVAVVNDPDDMTVTMYVVGAPILRNVLDVSGIDHDDAKPWILGAGMWGEELTDGWNGCIGETRLVTEALDEDQWLTARATDETPGAGDDSTEASTPEPTDEPSEEPTPDPTPEPSVTPTDGATDTSPTTEPTEAPSEPVAADDQHQSGDLANTGAGVWWLIIAGVAAIILGTIALIARRRKAVQR